MMHKHTPPCADPCCPEEPCLSGKRNRYFKRKNMTASDFQIEQDYGIARRRLLNHAIHGWGVAYGFALGPVSDENPTGHLKIGKGLALDRHGRELFRPTEGVIHSHEILLLGELKDQSERIKEAKDQANMTFPPAQKCLLQAHYAERCIDRIRIGHWCGCGEHEWNHVCETIVFSLLPICENGCQSAEPPCPACKCPSHHETRAPDLEERQEATAGLDRGPHDCLCEWLTNKPKDKDFPTDSDDFCGWNGFDVALYDAVPLACVTVQLDRCGHPVFKSIDDPCTPRRLVKTNDLLFDLIRGCDLTCISDVSWKDWHRTKKWIGWDKFEAMFPTVDEPVPPVKGKHSPVTTGFSVTFSGPVKKEMLTIECFAMTCLVKEKATGWMKTLRVPITGLDLKSQMGDPPETVRQATLKVSGGWCDDEIWDEESELSDHEFDVEIEIRGDLILDCHGQAVDANAVGLQAVPTGNGIPGGTYFSTFRVAPRINPIVQV